MYQDRGSARLIAIVGLIVLGSTCAACMILFMLLGGAYGGQTVALRNPFSGAQPTFIAQDSTGGGGGTDTTGTTSTTTTSGANTSTTSGGTTSTTSGGTTSTTTGGGAVAASGDASAYLPNLGGYSTADANSIEGAIRLINQVGGFGAQSANSGEFSAQSLSLSTIAASVLVTRIDDFIACYQRTGAVDAQVYIRTDLAAIASGQIPPLGAVVVVNESRLRANLVACAVSPGDPSTFGAQSVNQPCGNFGSFTAAGEEFTYLYAGSSSDFCSTVAGHFARYGG